MMNFKNFNDMHTHITKTYQLRAVRMAIRKNAAKNKWVFLGLGAECHHETVGWHWGGQGYKEDKT